MYSKKKYKEKILPFILPILFLIAWGILAVKIDTPIILPRLSSVINNFKNSTKDFIGLGSIPKNIFISFIRVILGYFIGVLIALPLGVLMGYSDIIYLLFNNFINMFRSVPAMSWGPLILAWFGVSSIASITNLNLGEFGIFLDNIKLSMLFIIGIGTFFPVVTNAMFAVRNVPKTLIESAEVLGATKADIFFKVLLPCSAPNIMTGMRTGLGSAWGCLIAAEMLPGSLSGIGYMISHAKELARTDLVITGIICIGLVGALLDYIFVIIERRHFSWMSRR